MHIWDSDGLALADGYDETTGRYRGLAIPNDHATLSVSDTTLIVKPADARAQRDRELSEQQATNAGETAGATTTVGPSGNQAGTAERAAPGKTRYFASKN
jgi:hypothetical protein